MNMRSVFWGALGLALVSGCAGPMFEGTIFEQPPRSNDAGTARMANATQQVSADVRQLSDRIDALNRSIEVVNGRLDRLEAQPKASGVGQEDLVGLRRDIQMIRTERETLKKEITDDLAARIEKIAARQQAEIRSVDRTSQTAPASAVRASGGGTASTPTRSGYEHKVERGQTLSEIARGYGTTVDAIMKANKLSNASSIRVGQVLFIPD